MRETMKNLISQDLTSQLNFISAPTLILWGEKDTTTPLADGQLMHQLIRNSRLHVVKNAGHSPYFTHAQEVAREILKEIRL